MAAITKTASAEWQGAGKTGKGTLTTESNVLSGAAYGFKTRLAATRGLIRKS